MRFPLPGFGKRGHTALQVGVEFYAGNGAGHIFSPYLVILGITKYFFNIDHASRQGGVKYRKFMFLPILQEVSRLLGGSMFTALSIVAA